MMVFKKSGNGGCGKKSILRHESVNCAAISGSVINFQVPGQYPDMALSTTHPVTPKKRAIPMVASGGVEEEKDEV
jgi:hypothetical protein